MDFEIRESTRMRHIFRKAAVTGLSVTALMTFVTSAHALNLITNGSFEQTTNGANLQFDDLTQLTGWSSPATGAGDAYNFVFSPGAADTTGANGEYGNIQLWGPNNGSANGLPATSPDGGNYVAADGAFQVGAISQTIDNLNIGDTYTLTFYFAGAQQSGFHGATTEGWQVFFGGQEQDTPILNNLDQGFTGWQSQTFTYTATATSEVLSFLAVGTPDGEPPFSLLDGVSLTDTPEPGSWGLMLGGLMVGLGVLRFKKRSKI
jgi:hypothetical protein